MYNLIYPFLGVICVFVISFTLYKIFGKSNKFSLLISLVFGFIYLVLMIPNTIVIINSDPIMDGLGKKCSVSTNDLYDELNHLNRYDPFFIFNKFLIKPDNCKDLEYCYWHTATYNQLEHCIEKQIDIRKLKTFW